MFFQHVYEKGLAQASYLIGCQATGQAIVIDPKRDIDTYLEIAKREKMKITHVTETHIHADFLSGSKELAQATGAEIFLSAEGGPDWTYQFAHVGLKDGHEFNVGNLRFKVMFTPGHTPEHISFLLTDVPAGDHPIMLFSGDFVFVGDVGRPDLLEKAAGIKGTQETGARQMFQSLKKFKALPDFVQVWPGHGAGSACGKALGSVPSTTVGYEKLVNWALQETHEEVFVGKLLDGQPEPPKYFAMMKRLNKQGAPVIGNRLPKKLSLKDIKEASREGIMIVDTRSRPDFAKAHIPGSLHIQDNASFSTWAGWMLSYDKPFVLIASDDRIGELVNKLIRIGLDNWAGYYSDVQEWQISGAPVESVEQITAVELRKRLEANTARVIDVRASKEFEEGHIPSALHIHLGYLSDQFGRLPQDETLVIQCGGGDRSSIACSLLKKHGIHNVVNLHGGIGAWKQEGFVVVR